MKRSIQNKTVSDIDPINDSKDWQQKSLRVVAYVRVSADGNDQKSSLKDQTEYLTPLSTQIQKKH